MTLSIEEANERYHSLVMAVQGSVQGQIIDGLLTLLDEAADKLVNEFPTWNLDEERFVAPGIKLKHVRTRYQKGSDDRHPDHP